MKWDLNPLYHWQGLGYMIPSLMRQPSWTSNWCSELSDTLSRFISPPISPLLSFSKGEKCPAAHMRSILPALQWRWSILTGRRSRWKSGRWQEMTRLSIWIPIYPISYPKWRSRSLFTTQIGPIIWQFREDGLDGLLWVALLIHAPYRAWSAIYLPEIPIYGPYKIHYNLAHHYRSTDFPTRSHPSSTHATALAPSPTLSLCVLSDPTICQKAFCSPSISMARCSIQAVSPSLWQNMSMTLSLRRQSRQTGGCIN